MNHISRFGWNFPQGDTGWLAPGRWMRTRTLVWAALLFCLTLGFFFASILGARWLGLASAWYYVAAIAMPVLAFVVYAFLVKRVERRHAMEMALDASMWRELGVGFILGAALIACILLMLYASGLYQVRPGQWSGWFDSLVFNSFISGMLEELAFRAILLRLLARVFGPVSGLILSSLLFGVAHLSHATLLAAAEVAFNGGLILGLLYMATGRLWLSIGFHIGWDFTEDSLLGVNTQHGLLQSIPNAARPEFLTGGPYGPDGSLLATLVGMVSIAVILAAHRKGWFRSCRLARAVSQGAY